jgi:hypothetical protein
MSPVYYALPLYHRNGPVQFVLCGYPAAGNQENKKTPKNLIKAPQKNETKTVAERD